MSVKLKSVGHLCGFTYYRHFDITELVPQIFGSVQSNESSTEETDQFDTADAADTHTRKKKPYEPLDREALVSQTMEASPA
jgi:hypothetical protein